MSASRFWLALVLSLSLAGCGDDDVAPVDAGRLDASGPDASAVDASAIDASAIDAASDAGLDAAVIIDVDASEPVDSGADDAGTIDAGAIDAGTDAGTVDAGTDAAVALDAGRDAGVACHEHGFGADAVAFRRVTSLPVMTGGAIPAGTYDAIDVQTTTAVSGTYRGTWVFEDETTLSQLQQITLAAPGPVVPRRYSYSTAGTTLSRVETCPGSEMLSTGYSVREQDGVYVLDVAQGALMISLRRR